MFCLSKKFCVVYFWYDLSPQLLVVASVCVFWGLMGHRGLSAKGVVLGVVTDSPDSVCVCVCVHVYNFYI